jgi:PAS domain-containing protein
VEAERRQKHLVLILAREFASQLSTPVFISDEQGNLVFYNESAEDLLGRTFAEAGEMAASEWQSIFEVETIEGEPMPLDEMPAGIALLERRPAHSTFRIRGINGREHVVAATGIPLLGHEEELHGVVVIFWEQR